MNDRKTTSRPSRPAGRDKGAVFPGLTLSPRAFRLLTRAALLLAAAILFAGPLAPAQQLPTAGSATDFNSVQYYGAPHQQEIKCLFSGAEADPIAGGLLLVKKVKLEKFDLDGKLQLVAEAPECIYDPVNAVANSSSAVHVRSGDGNLTMDGEGFLWREHEYLLTISNRVNTVFEKMPALKR
ncbi:MAG TPA: hypothetical protein VME24_05010 [Alphaproteobacteria bacterium]|nr:hypothetical protein [Alphaproteobacteria bacterium]